MTVADRIRDKRIELEWSQADLANRAKYCDKTAISKIENAGNEVTMKQVRRIAKALGVTVAYLMGWEEQADSLEDNTMSDFEKRAIQYYNLFLNATPEAQNAADLLLKSSQRKK